MTFEEEAKQKAFLAGGKIISNGETYAYQVGRREGWWKFGRGVFNGDCLFEYAERHWKEYLSNPSNINS